MTAATTPEIDPVPDSRAAMTGTTADATRAPLTRAQVEDFLYLEARLADENDYDGWEALWTDDAIYWVPADDPDADPLDCVSVIYDNRRRISTRLKQLRTGKRYAQAPASILRRQVTNVEILGVTDGGDVEVGANFLLLESRLRGIELWGGRSTYRLRPGDEGIRLAYKKIVLVNHDKVLPTLGFLI
jgi:3-phenylpropionate/cinnamic acid dioxygenase small subunit